MTRYRIRLKESLSERWQAFFPIALSTVQAEGRVLSELIGPLDEAALHGTLQTIRDLNLHLLSVDTLQEEVESEAF